MEKDETTMFTARLPKSLIKQIDKARKPENRSRSAEVAVRLAKSFPKADRRRSAA